MDLDAEYAKYRAYIEEFVKTIDPHDQLPLRVSGYSLKDFEIHGEILDWLMSYLGRSCPITLRTYMIPIAIKRTMEKVKSSPEECGFDPQRNVYQPLKLVRIVVGTVNNMILDLQDNSKLYEVPLPPTSSTSSDLTKLKQPPKYSVDAIKNSRRTMEDKHMIIDDFNEFFNTQDTEPTFYYGIFDGHSGSDAASYANSHLNYNIAVHPKYPSDIRSAMREAFLVTDLSFLRKAKAENLNSGTTALCAMYRKTEKKLYIGWCGDSQALIARVGNVRQIVKKHSPEDQNERKRIENLGGVVMFWGNSYRVNGALAVSRAIGDMAHKPYVSAEPEIECIDLDGEEDFIVLGCDGLWDSLTEDDVAITVYKKLQENPDNYRSIASDLCSLAKSEGSSDNISVIVVYLKEPHLIATQSWPSSIQQTKDIMENLNMYEEPPVGSPVTMDALGNTNQEIYNNPFGDFNNQLISDVSIGKSTEITDLVMQQQPDNAFCNLTDTMTNTLNNINNNKFNNGHGENNFMVQGGIPTLQGEPTALVSNDDNNNSNNDNLGPETDVDAIDEDFQFNAVGAVGGEKEKTQMEFKETEDVADRAEIMNFGDDHSAAIYGTLENKIFEELSLHNPDMIKGNNPFSSPEDFEPAGTIGEVVAPVSEFLDNKIVDEIEQHADDLADNIENFQNDNFGKAMDFISEAAEAAHEELINANEAVQEAIKEQEQPEADLGFVESTHQAIGESGGEDSEDEWNYIKVDKKTDGLAAVEETPEVIAESPTVEKTEELETNQAEDDHTLAESDKNLEHQRPEIESENIFEQEKEQSFVEEERQFQDELEKDLQLSIETEEFDEMSQLNPEAKEFVPVSPTRSNGPLSPPLNGTMNPVNPLLGNFVEDTVVSQSPRKGESPLMEDIYVPTEKDFDIEAQSRPHEINQFVENGIFLRTESPEALNLKESMQEDDKLEQGYKDEAQAFFEEEKQQTGEVYQVLESSFTEYSNGFQNAIDDSMNRSFYEGRDNGDILIDAPRNPDVLNSVQPIPTFDDEQPEADHQEFTTEKDAPEADWNIELKLQETADELAMATGLLGAVLSPAIEASSDNFKAERFVEEIKSVNQEFDKYVDQELSPTLPDLSLNIIQAVEEIVVIDKALDQVLDSIVSEASNIEVPQIEVAPEEFKEIPEVNEPPPTPATGIENQRILSPEPEKIIEKLEQETKVESEVLLSQIAGGAAAVAAVGIVAATKKKPASAGSKTDAKAKAPLATKSNPAPIRRPLATTATTKAAPVTKSSSAPAKPLAAKKLPASTTASKPAPKLSVSSAPISRPKPTSSTVPPVKKPSTGTISKLPADSTAKPTPSTRTTTLTKKTTVTSVAASKPPARPATAIIPSKPKTVGSTIERKPLASSAPITRAPPKPTSLATTAKPKPNVTSSTLSTKTSPRPTTSTTRASATEKATSPLKEKTLNRPAFSTTRSPRPATSAAAPKDLKSPSGAATKSSPLLGAVGAKKPLLSVKKSPVSTTTVSSTVTKKSPTKASSAVKKTTSSATTTTVVQKKIVNGDVVSEQTTTTVSGDPQLIEDILKDGLASELNGHGHTNGNGLAENGTTGDGIQMVLDSSAD